MVSDPDFFLDESAAAGSDSFLVHWEGNNDLHRTVQRIRTLGKRAGVVIDPAAPPAALEEIVHDVKRLRMALNHVEDEIKAAAGQSALQRSRVCSSG